MLRQRRSNQKKGDPTRGSATRQGARRSKAETDRLGLPFLSCRSAELRSDGAPKPGLLPLPRQVMFAVCQACCLVAYGNIGWAWLRRVTMNIRTACFARIPHGHRRLICHRSRHEPPTSHRVGLDPPPKVASKNNSAESHACLPPHGGMQNEGCVTPEEQRTFWLCHRGDQVREIRKAARNDGHGVIGKCALSPPARTRPLRVTHPMRAFKQ